MRCAAGRVLADDDIGRNLVVGDAFGVDDEAGFFELLGRVCDVQADDVGDEHGAAATAVVCEQAESQNERDDHHEDEDSQRGCKRAPAGHITSRGGRRADARRCHRGGRGRAACFGDERGDGHGRNRTTAPEPEEVGAHVVGGLIAEVGVLGERGEDDLLEVGGNVGVASRRRNHVLAHVLVRDRDR